MMRLANLRANNLMVIAIASAFFAGAAFLLPVPKHRGQQIAYFLTILVMILAGLYINYKAELSLQDRFLGDQDSAELMRLRRFLTSALWAAIAFAPLLLAIFLMAMRRERHIGWACLTAGRCLTRLRIVALRPKEKAPQPSWRSFKPLHSDHWGHR